MIIVQLMYMCVFVYIAKRFLYVLYVAAVHVDAYCSVSSIDYSFEIFIISDHVDDSEQN